MLIEKREGRPALLWIRLVHILNALVLMDLQNSPCTSSDVKALESNNVFE